MRIPSFYVQAEIHGPLKLILRKYTCIRTAYEIFGPPYVQAQLKSMHSRNIDEELATCLNICTGLFYGYKFNVTVTASSAVVTTQWMQRDQTFPICKGCGLQD